MAMKNISDYEVVLSYWLRREKNIDLWPYEILQFITDQPEKVCYRAMERADARGLIEYGVSLRSGWLTEEGENLLKIVKYTKQKDKVFNEGL